MPVERVTLSGLTQEAQNALMQGLVTGTAISKTPSLNCNPFESPLEYYHRFVGDLDLPPKKQTGAMLRGRYYEPAAAAMLSDRRPTLRLEKCQFALVDRARRYGGRPDYLLHGDPRGIGLGEIKTHKPHIWAALYGDGGAPAEVVAQTLWYAMLLDAAYGLIAAMSCDPDNPELAIVEVPRHEAAERRLIEAADDFLAHVDAGREPEVTPGRDLELLTYIFPREDKGKVVDLSHDNELVALLHGRADLRDEIGLAEARCAAIETEVKKRMGDAERIIGLDEFRVTWKVTDYPEHTVPARSKRVLRIYDRRK